MTKVEGIRIAPTHLMLDAYFGDDVEAIGEEIDKRYDYDFDDQHYRTFYEVMRERKGFAHQVVDEDGMLRLIMWVLDPNDLVTISHEIIHVTWYVQYLSGFRFSFDAQEIQAYLHDYVMEQILKSFR